MDVAGLVVSSLLLKYRSTSYDQYFAPYYKITSSGQLLWPYSMNSTLSNYSKTYIQIYETYQSLRSNATAVEQGLDEMYRELHRDLLPYDNFTIVTVMNPIWTAFSAWNISKAMAPATPNSYSPMSDELAEESNVIQNIEYLKYIQCQKRIYSGNVDLFVSCVDELRTGRGALNESMQILSYHGNLMIP